MDLDLATLTRFLGWCTLLNLGLLLWISIWLMAAPEWVYRIQSRWFAMSRETFTVVMYAFLGLFKLLWIVFNLVPYLALRIVG